MSSPSFASIIIDWQQKYGRKDLPWQGLSDAYRVWLSEIMLQQTNVKTVTRYYDKFLESFPDVMTLAGATEDEVLKRWSGLGFYRRARNLLKAAKIIAEERGGVFPHRFNDLVSLPGVGRSTAGAIMAFAFGQKYAILDGNVKRVLTRFHLIQEPVSSPKIIKRLWDISEHHLPNYEIGIYTQGLMDLGATVCTPSSPHCQLCPISVDCQALSVSKTSEIPVRPITKKPPLRKINYLVLIDRGMIMLERRPSEGIWGGLLSFPEFLTHLNMVRFLETHSDHESFSVIQLKPILHKFSHFQLQITPFKVLLPPTVRKESFSHGSWFPLEEIASQAVPVPVRKLIDLYFLPDIEAK